MESHHRFSTIPHYFVADTVALITILHSLPHIVSGVVFFSYIWFHGYPQTMRRAFGRTFDLAEEEAENEPLTVTKAASAFGGALIIDGVCLAPCLLFCPKSLGYVNLLGDAFLSARFMVAKERRFLTALFSFFFLVCLETLQIYLAKRYSTLPEMELELFPHGYKSFLPYYFYIQKLKSVSFYLKINTFVDIARSLLATHTILVNLEPFRKLLVANKLSRSLDQLATISTALKPSSKPVVPVTMEKNEIPSIKVDGNYVTPVTDTSIKKGQKVTVAHNFQTFCSYAFSSASGAVKRHIPKSKFAGFRSHQPLWFLVLGAKTMFEKQDLYSGVSENHYLNEECGALTLNSTFTRDLYHLNQCYVSFIGETSIGLQISGMAIIESLLVRVNQVIWLQVSAGSIDSVSYIGISGLTPLSQYEVEVINVNENGEWEMLSRVTVSTIMNDLTLSQSKKTTPMATLQESLVTTNESVSRERFKLKKVRKEYSKKIHTIKNDIENLKKKLDTNDKSDERNYRKILSLKQTLKKIYESNSEIEEEIMDCFSEEGDLNESYYLLKRQYENAMKSFQAVEDEHKNKVSSRDEEIDSLRASHSQLVLKKEKIDAKKDKVAKEVAKLQQEINALKHEDLSIRRARRAERQEKRDQKMKEYVLEISKLERIVHQLSTENYKLLAQDSQSQLHTVPTSFSGNTINS